MSISASPASESKYIASQYPLFQAVTSYLAFAQVQAKSERLPQPQSQPQPGVSRNILIAGVIVVILMALIFFGVAFVRRRGKKSRQTASKQPTFTSTPPDVIAQNDQMRTEWSFPVPVRPSSDQEPHLSAYGHLNTSDARYCRTCGMPVMPG